MSGEGRKVEWIMGGSRGGRGSAGWRGVGGNARRGG